MTPAEQVEGITARALDELDKLREPPFLIADISAYQPVPDASKLTGPWVGAILKATEGLHYAPQWFIDAWRAIGTRPELLSWPRSPFGRVQVPGSASALLELRLGEAGHDALGFAVHVPHYLAQSAYPAAAVTALETVINATGLAIPGDALREAAAETDKEIAAQVEGSDEVQKVVRALEQQYDAFAGASERESLLAEDAPMPTAEELAAQFEQFLAEQDGDS